MENIKKDEIVLFSSGEYSDYSIQCMCIALEDINTEEVRNDYINLHPEQTIRYKLDESMFVKYLFEKNLVKEISFKEWYTGAYSSISEMDVTVNSKSFT